MQRENDDVKYVHSHYWIPEGKLERANDKEYGAKYLEWAKKGYITIVEGNEVDSGIVADWYMSLFKNYGIRTFMTGYDQRFSKEFLKKMEMYGFETELIMQNKYTLSNPMRLVEADIRDELINYNNNPIDKWCLGNTSIQVFNTGHILPVKIKGQAGRRIDGTASLLDVYEVYRRYRTEFKNGRR